MNEVLKYPLEWLDLLITVTLNPKRTNIHEITDAQYSGIITRIDIEKTNLQSLINNRIFSISNENEIDLLIKQYHSSLIVLLDQALENQSTIPPLSSLKEVYKALVIGNSEYTIFGNYECSIIGNNKYIVHLLEHRVPKEKTSFVIAIRQSNYELLFK